MRSKILYELRIRGINSKQPGYDMLIISIEEAVRRAKRLTEKEITDTVKRSNMVIPRVSLETNRSPEIQWITEVIRSAGYNDSVESFVNEIMVIVIKEIIKEITEDAIKLNKILDRIVNM